MGTRIGPFTGLIGTNWPDNIRNNNYGWKSAFGPGVIVNATMTDSHMAFFNDAPDNINSEKNRIRQINFKRIEENKSEKNVTAPQPQIPDNAATSNVSSLTIRTKLANGKLLHLKFYQIIRTIYPYEQLLIDYGPGYWEDRERKYFTPIPPDKVPTSNKN